MSAEAAEVEELNWRVVDGLLKEWGVWIDGHSDWTTYPGRAAIAGVIYPPNYFNWFRVKQLTAKGVASVIFGGHRILCFDMPPRIRIINLCVNSLSGEQYDAVLAWYGLGVKEDGTVFSPYEKAMALDLQLDALERRLERARKKLRKILATAWGNL